jgi:hypothetical protein
MELMDSTEHLKLSKNKADRGNQPKIKNFQNQSNLHS